MLSAAFSPVSAAVGGALIGLAASWMLLSSGRVAGISGIVAGLLRPRSGDLAWRAAFVAGLLIAGGVALLVAPGAIAASGERSVVLTLVAGGIVGIGVRMGSGCTSGHGVCGLSRLSQRSMVAVAVFMATGFVTATAVQLLAGGSL